MTQLFAQPYDISATGFYFDTVEKYEEQAGSLRNSYGEPVEEFEIQFIDGDDIDAALFRALSVYQGDISNFLEACDEWDDDNKVKVIIAVGEAGYSFDSKTSHPNDFDVDIYEIDSLRDLAEQFVDEGLFGDIPENIQCYLDYDAIARDLGMDYSETTIAGRRYVWRG